MTKRMVNKMWDTLYFLGCLGMCYVLEKIRRFLDSKYDGRYRRVVLLIMICISYMIFTVLEFAQILILGKGVVVQYPLIMIFYAMFAFLMETAYVGKIRGFISVINIGLLFGYPILLSSVFSTL